MSASSSSCVLGLPRTLRPFRTTLRPLPALAVFALAAVAGRGWTFTADFGALHFALGYDCSVWSARMVLYLCYAVLQSLGRCWCGRVLGSENDFDLHWTSIDFDAVHGLGSLCSC